MKITLSQLRKIILSEVEKRSHMSKSPLGAFRNMPPRLQIVGTKPRGLWYDCDGSWSEWIEWEAPSWKGDYLYDIRLNHDKILTLSGPEDIKEFTKKYGVEKPRNFSGRDIDIDWKKVASEYSGIEIHDVWSSRDLNNWIYTWDIDSGCIWNEDAILEIKPKDNH
jgi:hypothetical protein